MGGLGYAINRSSRFYNWTTGGIGSEICRSLAKEGADISICYHTKLEEVQLLCKEITSLGKNAIVVQADVSNPVRTQIKIPQEDGIILYMPGYIEDSGALGLKIVSVFPINAVGSFTPQT